MNRIVRLFVAFGMVVMIYIALLVSTLLSVTDHYHVKFQTYNRGFRYNPKFSVNLIAVQSSIRSITRCSMICAANTDCQTVDFDYSMSRCRLFAEWIYEGSLPASSTSQIAYISPRTSYYQLYNQTCRVTEEENRFLQCINGRWTCQPNFYWNGTACSRVRTFNETCPRTNWCDTSRYLICLNISGRCACNHSMTWNGSRCTPICPPGQMGVTFDDLSDRTDLFTLMIPNGYAQLDWSNVWMSMPMPNDTGYLNSRRSHPYVAFNNYGNTLYITHPTKTFTLNSMYATSAHIPSMTAEFKASPGSFYKTIGLSLYNATFITFNNWTNIDTVELRSLTSAYNDQIAIDNICVTW